MGNTEITKLPLGAGCILLLGVFLLFLQSSIGSDCSSFTLQDKETGSILVSLPAPDLCHFFCSQDLQPLLCCSV